MFLDKDTLLINGIIYYIGDFEPLFLRDPLNDAIANKIIALRKYDKLITLPFISSCVEYDDYIKITYEFKNQSNSQDRILYKTPARKEGIEILVGYYKERNKWTYAQKH